jgi:transposase InsO family protein
MEKTIQYFTWLFYTYGLPLGIRTDNGVPFASNALARLSQLSVWFVKLGIYPELIEPGEPQQNGVHERMHRTLKQEATLPRRATCEPSSAGSMSSVSSLTRSDRMKRWG